MLFLLPSQQCQTTEDNRVLFCWFVNTSFKDVTLLNKLSQPWARCKHKPSVNCKTAHVCVHNAYQCTHLLNTVQHRTVLIVFPFTLQTVITTLCCRLLTKTCLYSVHLNDSEGQNEIFWMAKQMVKERQDITGSRAANEKIMHWMIQAPK